MINLAVIGATGSVGSSVMSVCEAWPDKICVKAIAANSRSEKLLNLAEKFNIKKIYIYQESGESGLEEIANDPEINHIVFSMLGTEERQKYITCK